MLQYKFYIALIAAMLASCNDINSGDKKKDTPIREDISLAWLADCDTNWQNRLQQAKTFPSRTYEVGRLEQQFS